MTYKIYKYTDKHKRYLSCKAKTEPWLHIMISQVDKSFIYAIYVWDTRKVIETGKANASTLTDDLLRGMHVPDNHKVLLGNDAIVKMLNKVFDPTEVSLTSLDNSVQNAIAIWKASLTVKNQHDKRLMQVDVKAKLIRDFRKELEKNEPSEQYDILAKLKDKQDNPFIQSTISAYQNSLKHSIKLAKS